MTRIGWISRVSLIVIMSSLVVLTFSASSHAQKTVLIGGAFALSSPFGEDTANDLLAFQNYAKYVNDNHIIAPWYPDRKFPTNVKLEVVWQDDQYQPTNVIPVYEAIRGKGALVYRNSGTAPDVLASRLMEDHVGATSMSCEPSLLAPPKTIFTQFPTFVDSVAAVADWFKAHWKEKRKPRYAFFTGDNDTGRSVITPEFQEYLKQAGFEFVGSSFVPFVPTSPPTTQLLWLKEKKVDLAIGMMIRAGSEPSIKEAVRLGMGKNGPYKITFGFSYPTSMSPFARDMGKLGDGVFSGGDLPDWDMTDLEGVRFCLDLMKKYSPDKTAPKIGIGYIHGTVEAMVQTEALRLASLKQPLDQIKDPKVVLENGWWLIKDFDTKGMRYTKLTYGPQKAEGLSALNVSEVVDGKDKIVGEVPIRMILPKY
ncbi:MAG: ABC transporter substrate-binding protein [Syntrophorhabdales bacterium]